MPPAQSSSMSNEEKRKREKNDEPKRTEGTTDMTSQTSEEPKRQSFLSMKNSCGGHTHSKTGFGRPR